MTLHLFGVRHHGPGCARSLRRALEALEPDIVLVEGPPDANDLLPLVTHEAMRPPVALLVYAPDEPRRAAFFPFAVFSPEWQALDYALRRGVPVRFMDLPVAHRFALQPALPVPGLADPNAPAGAPPAPGPPAAVPGTAAGDGLPQVPPGTVGKPATAGSPAASGGGEGATPQAADGEAVGEGELSAPNLDPLAWLARAAGYSDSERWWEHLVEQRRDARDLFAAILEAMTALRAELPPAQPAQLDPLDELREAWMRRAIREAQRAGFGRIAVVCGAWHAPALADPDDAARTREDAARLKGLPKAKVAATWTPWTHGRLAQASGYGAGIRSPGWYHHLWTLSGESADGAGTAFPEATAGTDGSLVAPRWLARVARLLREAGIDTSSAAVIEATRLAEALAALRDAPAPGLEELHEATLAVLCGGNAAPLGLVHDRLIVGEELGAVPESTPRAPLLRDLEREQRRLRLPAQATERTLDLDLRRDLDRDRSHLLHRLALLGVAWGQRLPVDGKRGTFHELWRLRWDPVLAVELIEAGVWGNTVRDAAAARARDLATRSPKLNAAGGSSAPELPELTRLVEAVLLADLPEAVPQVVAQLESRAALTSDVTALMAALPPLVSTLRYGNVRRTDAAAVAHVVDGLVARVAIGLPLACASLDDEAAAAMRAQIDATHAAIGRLDRADHAATWQATLRRLMDQAGLHGLIAGRACRLLLDASALGPEEATLRAARALSVGEEPARSAAWVEGFLSGNPLLLLHDDALFAVLDAWIAAVPADGFTAALPLLRRTFATVPTGARRQLGERIAHGGPAPRAGAGAIDHARAAAVLPVLSQVLGLDLALEPASTGDRGGSG